MSVRAERLFKKLQTINALRELIGTSENSELECKQWSTPGAICDKLLRGSYECTFLLGRSRARFSDSDTQSALR